jgi:hypothetical protein
MFISLRPARSLSHFHGPLSAEASDQRVTPLACPPASGWSVLSPGGVTSPHWIPAPFSRRTSAILYTIVECCRRRGIDPYVYLRDILTRLPTATNWQIADLTPEAWAQKHQPPLRQAA